MEIKNIRLKRHVNTFTHTEFAIFYEEDKAYRLIMLGYGEKGKGVKIVINKEELKNLKELINKK